ncbi:MAG: class I SAM-dependent methyltransferase [Epsilonproteobacteria bacterium]|nr:class I SAM-dependent methyltransferase [Campylobacterota bacterium]
MSFDARAAQWDASKRRNDQADAAARAIIKHCPLTPQTRLLDFGAGTGLLTERLLPHIAHAVAVDTSAKMLEALGKKMPQVEKTCCDIMAYEPKEPFDGVVSSMTLHHIPDISALFLRLKTMVRPGGFLAIVDLAPEDGTFHDGGNEGVYHFGFAPQTLHSAVQKAGWQAGHYRIIHTVTKAPDRRYDLFLYTARR